MGYPLALFQALFRCVFRSSVLSSKYSGVLPPLELEQERLREALHRHVVQLAGVIGERNVDNHEKLLAASDYIASEFAAMGYEVAFQEFTAEGVLCKNIEVELKGSAAGGEIIVIGAHYDSVAGSPGANDNATGVAAVLEIARAVIKKDSPGRTMRFVAFANEEPPFFQSSEMGSYLYAERSRQRGEQIVGMFSLETIGCYSSGKGSQRYPFPLKYFFPDRGNFIAFVSNDASGTLLYETVKLFNDFSDFPSEGAVLPEVLPGVAWSDQWAFWQAGFPAVMVTDTAPFRYAYYHTPDDTVDKIDYDNTARVVSGLEKVVYALANAKT